MNILVIIFVKTTLVDININLIFNLKILHKSHSLHKKFMEIKIYVV